jgi:hypothetical protein
LCSFFFISSGIPSSVVRYVNHNLTSPPVHLNLSDYQRFVPHAVSAGWMDAPPPPSLYPVLDGPHFFEPGTGFGLDYNFIGLLQNFFDELGFFVASGEWTFTIVYRNRSGQASFPICILIY